MHRYAHVPGLLVVFATPGLSYRSGPNAPQGSPYFYTRAKHDRHRDVHRDAPRPEPGNRRQRSIHLLDLQPCRPLRRDRTRRAHWVEIDQATFPRAPLRSCTVGFPEYSSDLGFPPEAFPTQGRLKRWLAYTPPESVYLQARPSRMAPPTHVVDHPETAKCPELLCLSPALLAPGWCPAPPRRALPLRPRSYELMRQTTFLRRTFVFRTYIQRSLQVAASPCWKGVLPDVALQSFPGCLGPDPGGL